MDFYQRPEPTNIRGRIHRRVCFGTAERTGIFISFHSFSTDAAPNAARVFFVAASRVEKQLYKGNPAT
jgi:hypothetical protein